MRNVYGMLERLKMTAVAITDYEFCNVTVCGPP
jgi:hypothetical protein